MKDPARCMVMSSRSVFMKIMVGIDLKSKPQTQLAKARRAYKEGVAELAHQGLLAQLSHALCGPSSFSFVLPVSVTRPHRGEVGFCGHVLATGSGPLSRSSRLVIPA